MDIFDIAQGAKDFVQGIGNRYTAWRDAEWQRHEAEHESIFGPKKEGELSERDKVRQMAEGMAGAGTMKVVGQAASPLVTKFSTAKVQKLLDKLPGIGQKIKETSKVFDEAAYIEKETLAMLAKHYPNYSAKLAQDLAKLSPNEQALLLGGRAKRDELFGFLDTLKKYSAIRRNTQSMLESLNNEWESIMEEGRRYGADWIKATIEKSAK